MWPRKSFLVFVTSNLSPLHPFCDGVFTCSSIPLQWNHATRIRKLDNFGVTSHVHGNDLRKHILCLSNSASRNSGWGSLVLIFDLQIVPFPICPITSLVFVLGNCLTCFGGKPHGPGTFPTVCVVSIPDSKNPQKRCPPFLVGRTQFFGQNIARKFVRIPDWCCHTLTTMANLATSYFVDDVLAINKKQQFSQNGLVACLNTSLCIINVPFVAFEDLVDSSLSTLTSRTSAT